MKRLPVMLRAPVPADRKVWLDMVFDYDPDIRQPEVDWDRLMQHDPDVVCLVACLASRPVGFMQYMLRPQTFIKGPVCYLADLYVAPVYRRSGIARYMLQHLMTQARTENWTQVEWITEHDNPARELYDQYGIAEFVRYHTDLTGCK